MKNKTLLIVGIMALIFIIVIVQVKNKQDRLDKELQRIQEEKEFCDNLEISIEPFDISKAGFGYPAGVNYCLNSNKDTNAKSIVTLINGRKIEESENLKDGSCMIQQIQFVAGYEGQGYRGDANCEDIKSIELISERCPQIKDIVTDMDEITCGI